MLMKLTMKKMEKPGRANKPTEMLEKKSRPVTAHKHHKPAPNHPWRPPRECTINCVRGEPEGEEV